MKLTLFGTTQQALQMMEGVGGLEALQLAGSQLPQDMRYALMFGDAPLPAAVSNPHGMLKPVVYMGFLDDGVFNVVINGVILGSEEALWQIFEALVGVGNAQDCLLDQEIWVKHGVVTGATFLMPGDVTLVPLQGFALERVCFSSTSEIFGYDAQTVSWSTIRGKNGVTVERVLINEPKRGPLFTFGEDLFGAYPGLSVAYQVGEQEPAVIGSGWKLGDDGNPHMFTLEEYAGFRERAQVIGECTDLAAPFLQSHGYRPGGDFYERFEYAVGDVYDNGVTNPTLLTTLAIILAGERDLPDACGVYPHAWDVACELVEQEIGFKGLVLAPPKHFWSKWLNNRDSRVLTQEKLGKFLLAMRVAWPHREPLLALQEKFVKGDYNLN